MSTESIELAKRESYKIEPAQTNLDIKLADRNTNYAKVQEINDIENVMITKNIIAGGSILMILVEFIFILMSALPDTNCTSCMAGTVSDVASSTLNDVIGLINEIIEPIIVELSICAIG